MNRFRSIETMEYFVGVLSSVPEGAAVAISNEPDDPDRNTYENLVPNAASVTRRKYHGEEEKYFKEGMLPIEGMVEGVNVQGLDLDDEKPVQTFFPNITSVQIYVPEHGIGEAS
jgi:hypothetical protein